MAPILVIKIINIGGDHSVAIGSINGILEHNPNTAILWIDAHADINTLESSTTGNIHGMPVAFLSGLEDYKKLGDFSILKKEFIAQKNILLKLENAKKLSELNYKQHLKEARQGLVSQLDVLRVLEESIQAQQIYDQQEFEIKKAWVQLKVLAGVVP